MCGAFLPQAAADSSNGRAPRARIHTAREREFREACTHGPRLQKLLWADEVRSLVVSLQSSVFSSFETTWVALLVEEACGSLGPELPVPSFSPVSGGSGSEEASEEALGWHALEASADPGGLESPPPEALGGGGLLGGAEVRWTDAVLLLCSAPSLEARARRTTSPGGECSFPV